MRAFIAVEIPAADRRAVIRALAGEKKSLPAKWVEFENLHITLKFFGEIGPALAGQIVPAITEAVSGIAPFSLSLEGVGCFPDARRPRVIWIGVDKDGGGRLTALARLLDEKLAPLAVRRDEKNFHPHLTVARIKAPCRIVDKLPADFRSGPFAVDRVVLFESKLKPTGAVYEKIETFLLPGQGR